MATFHPLQQTTDQNMDRHTESGWKHDPTAPEECEMNFRNNLTAFSWKGAAANRRPIGLSDGLGDSSATVSANRAPPAAVAELGRCSAAAADSLVRKKKRTTEVPAKKNKFRRLQLPTSLLE
jgi:hypothetical protein